MSVKDLSGVSVTEQKQFINSVKQVITDVDGVLWLLGKPIEGSAKCIEALRNLGKNVIFVSNNCVISTKTFHTMLEAAGFGSDPVLINPTAAIIHYLKKIQFDKEIHVLGSSVLKKELKNAGFKIASSDAPGDMEITILNIFDYLSDNHNIGAVIVDWDVNLSLLEVQRALIYLKRPDVHFITGATDSKLPIGRNVVLMGPKYIQKPIEDISGRAPIVLAKPDARLNEYITEKCGSRDPSKILFIGDTINEDMTFATNCGFKKLLVLSGITKQGDVENWQHREELKPDYYVENLGKLYEIISNFK